MLRPSDIPMSGCVIIEITDYTVQLAVYMKNHSLQGNEFY